MYTKKNLLELAHCSASTLSDLCKEAGERRSAYWGNTLTYSRKVFVALTNMCRDSCGYCTFVQDPDSPNARIMTPDQVLKVVQQGKHVQCKEVLFSLGEKPELRHQKARDLLAGLGYQRMTDYLRAMCELVIEQSSLIPHVNAGTLSKEELQALKPVCGSMGMMLENISPRLLKKGGPHHACPDKVPKVRLATLEEAGRQSIPFTTGLLIGIGETWEERLDTLLAINRIHQAYGHIQEVIVQNFTAKPDTAMAEHPEPSHHDMLKTLAVARLVLDPSISLQAPPNLSARFTDYVDAGINDWGGISPVTIDHINPERAWPQLEQLQAEVNKKGFRLQERLTAYPRYLKEAQTFLHENMRERTVRLARDDGLAIIQIV